MNSEQEIEKATEKYLSALKAQNEEKFNQQLKEQVNEIITAITHLMPADIAFPDLVKDITKMSKNYKSNQFVISDLEQLTFLSTEA